MEKFTGPAGIKGAVGPKRNPSPGKNEIPQASLHVHTAHARHHSQLPCSKTSGRPQISRPEVAKNPWLPRRPTISIKHEKHTSSND
jgi:hypothetical protein